MKILDAQGRFFGRLNLIDAIVLAFLLSLIPLVQYVHGGLMGHFALSIERVEPATVTAGANQRLTIMGNGFDARSTIQLSSASPQQAAFINDARLDLPKIPSQIEPGWHSISVTNGRGRLVRRLDAVFVIWQPEIEAVSPPTIPADAQTFLTITGRYFDTNCAITLGVLEPVHVRYLGATQVQALFLPPKTMRGLMDLQVTNHDGRRAVLTQAVDVVPPIVKVTNLPPAESVKMPPSPPTAPAQTLPPPELPPEHTPWTHRLPDQFLATCAFFDLEREQAHQIKRGAMEFDPNGGAHRATVVEVLRPRSWMLQAGRNGGSRQTVVAQLLLSGTRSPRGSPPVYFYRGEPLIAAGIPLQFRFGGQDFVGMTLVGCPTVMVPQQRRKP